MSEVHSLRDAGAAQPADSAGVPWQGRTLPATEFAGDDGLPDARLRAALSAAASGAVDEMDRDEVDRDEVEMVAAVSGARLMVPVVAIPTDVDPDGELARERSSEVALMSITGTDGRRALPVFTGTAALRAWNPDARPVPVRAASAAQAAVAEGCHHMVLDLGGTHEHTLRPSMVWALATGRAWTPAHADPVVAKAVRAASTKCPSVRSTRTEAGNAGALRIVLGLAPGLSAAQIRTTAALVGERIATDGEVRARIDALEFVIEPG